MIEMTTTEIYKGVIYQGCDYSDRLEVSNKGHIRNTKTKHIYKLQANKKGYLGVYISLGSKSNGKLFKLHRAVAETFIPNPDALQIINHKDGVKKNCEPYNLEWCTHKYNCEHAFENKLRKNKKGVNDPRSKFTHDDIQFIRNNYKPYDKTFGAKPLCEKFNVTHATISKIVNNKRYETDG